MNTFIVNERKKHMRIIPTLVIFNETMSVNIFVKVTLIVE